MFRCQCKCGCFSSSEATCHSSLVIGTGLIVSIAAVALTKHCSRNTPKDRASPQSVCSSSNGNLFFSSLNSGPTTSLNRLIGSRCSSAASFGEAAILYFLLNHTEQPRSRQQFALRFLVGAGEGDGLNFESLRHLFLGSGGRLEEVVNGFQSALEVLGDDQKVGVVGLPQNGGGFTQGLEL